MNDHLFVLLLSLTLLDVGFVHATDVVPALDLLPMWLLTAFALWLRRLQRFRVYRATWNVGVVLVFASLVHHATTTGLLHMLEDGLLLAVLCQVHLLNNVGERQRPDLIFFNSFLIAFVTSFFAPDVTWSALFVAHAFALVPGLQMLALSRSGVPLAPALVRTVWRDGVPRTLAVVALTAVAFVLVPRDFRREGWLGDALALGQQFETGLAERIRIDDEHATRLPENIVARLVPASGRAGDVPEHWRATAFSSFDGSAWSPQDARLLGSRFATDPVWERHPDGSLRRSLPGGPTTRVSLHLFDREGNRLLVPLAATLIAPAGGDSVAANPRSDGAIRLLDEAGPKRASLDCEVEIAAASGTVAVAASTRAHMTLLPDNLPDVVHDLAHRLRAGVDAGAGVLAIADASCTWMQQNRRYDLPGQPGFARNLGEFLLGSGTGHCEYFATALALLLRAQQVPCRLVGGYLAHEWDAATRSVVVRGKHAHAWVEVLDEAGSWHTYDPTPAADVRNDRDLEDGFWATLRRELEGWWAAITGFDQASRDRWLMALRTLPSEHPLALAGLLAASCAFVHVRRRRSLPSIAALQRALRKAGLSLQRGETPRELLARATRADLAPDVFARLQSAARQHEANRYGGRADRC